MLISFWVPSGLQFFRGNEFEVHLGWSGRKSYAFLGQASLLQGQTRLVLGTTAAAAAAQGQTSLQRVNAAGENHERDLVLVVESGVTGGNGDHR